MLLNNYVSLDLETTGLNPKSDKIIEIGAIKVINGVEMQQFSTFINPGIKLEKIITDITGIRDEDLKEAREIGEVIKELVLFIGDLPLLGHSILFDFSFVKRAAVNQKLVFEKEGIDTLKIARKYLPELPSRNLGCLCEYFQIPHMAHRALEDAKATDLLYRKLAEQFYQEQESEFMPMKLQYQVKKESPITKHQKERLEELIKIHKLNVPYEVEKLSKNEASRYTDKILAKYGR